MAETIFIYLYAVETKGRTLEETALLFDDVVEADTLAACANTHGGHLAKQDGMPDYSTSDSNSDEKAPANDEDTQQIDPV